MNEPIRYKGYTLSQNSWGPQTPRGTPVRGATLIGNGPDVLTKVSRVGYDLKLDRGIGTCGKEGQSVPVGVGIPTIKVDQLTVGGTNVLRTGSSFQD